MLNRLPSLNALRAFEAAMRCQGLAGAATELAVTASAISHQIKQLEQELGLKLVQREGRRLTLTPAGERLVPGLREAFARIGASVREVQQQEASAPLTVNMFQTFAVNWFLPRLDRFHARHPGIELQLVLATPFVDFARDRVDLAVRLTTECGADHHCQELFRDELTPVCSPAYLERYGPFHSPADLLGQRLLISDSRPADAWRAWFASIGIAAGPLAHAMHLETSHLALQAAANGIGFAICGRRLMQSMMRRGAIVAPFRESVPEHGAFCTVCPEAWASRPKIRLMRQWLQEEVRADALV